MQNCLDIEDLRIPIVLKRAKRKTLSVTVTSEGELLIKAPERMSEREIGRFLTQRRYWIYKQTKHMLAFKSDRISRSEEEIKELRQQARVVLTDKTEYFKSIVGVDYERIRIGDQKTRWGSCSSKGTISYNWRLILVPEEILDYVVVHELCHLREMNHSKRFWDEVSEIIPDYKARRKWLKENSERFQ